MSSVQKFTMDTSVSIVTNSGKRKRHRSLNEDGNKDHDV